MKKTNSNSAKPAAAKGAAPKKGPAKQPVKTKLKLQPPPKVNEAIVTREVTLAEMVAKSIAIPKENPPFRYATAFNSAPSSVASPFLVEEAHFGDPDLGPVEDYPDPSFTGAFLFRNPLRAIVMLDGNSSGVTYTYGWRFFQSNGPLNSGVISTVTQVTANVNACPGAGAYLQPVYGVAGTAYQPHGRFLFTGRDGQTAGRFMWIDTYSALNSSLDITFTAPGAEECQFYLDSWSEGKVILAVASTPILTGAVAVASLAPPSPGYYAIRCATTGALANIAVEYSNLGSPSWCHRPLPDLIDHLSAVQGVRMIAASMMWTNEAAPINRQGKVTQAQLPAGTHWTTYATGDNPFTNLSKLKGNRVGPAADGGYSFLKPAQTLDLDYMTLWTVEDGTLTDAAFSLAEKCPYLGLFVEIATEAGRDAYWTYAFGVEFLTTDTWYDVRASVLSSDVYEEGLEMIRDVTQHYENSIHWNKIWTKIKQIGTKVLGAAVQYGPSVIKGATSLLGLL